MFTSNVKEWATCRGSKFVIKSISRDEGHLEDRMFLDEANAELWWKNNKYQCEKECHPIERVEQTFSVAVMHTLEELTENWCAWVKLLIEEDPELTLGIEHLGHYIDHNRRGGFAMLVKASDGQNLADIFNNVKGYMARVWSTGIHIEFELKEVLHNDEYFEITATVTTD